MILATLLRKLMVPNGRHRRRVDRILGETSGPEERLLIGREVKNQGQ